METAAERNDALRRLENAIEEYGRAERIAGMMGGVDSGTRAAEAKEQAVQLAREIIYTGETTHV